MTNTVPIVQSDVLVIGGAGAGLTAAIEARSRGAAVVVASKGRAGRSGNTVVAGSQFSVAIPYPQSEDSPERHFQDTLKGGKYINDESLVRVFAEQGGRRVLKLEDWGVVLQRKDGELVRRLPPGHSWPRGIPAYTASHPYSVGGLSITVPLRETAERMGVRFLDDTPVVRLLLHDGEVWGAVALDLNEGKLLALAARAVVIAAGGAGQVFANTNNTRGISGDSYGLMLDAGATLRDMEFVQFYPTQMSRPFKVSVTTSFFGDGAVLRNQQGDRFMPFYDPANGDMATRDMMSRAIYYEVQKGNGVDGGAYMDCTAVPESILQDKYGPITRDFRRQGVEPLKDWLKVVPTVHFFMGGALVDERCYTGVPGLFAAGEAVGGVHGANRLSGNALTEIVVFGGIAGEAAAEYAAGRGAVPELRDQRVSIEGAGGDEPLDATRSRLRAAMWNGASIVRTEDSLRAALSAVEHCAREVESYRASSVSELASKGEMRSMCLTAEAIVRSALAREESRGAHFREDRPESSGEWLGSNLVRLEVGEMRVSFVPKASGRRVAGPGGR